MKKLLTTCIVLMCYLISNAQTWKEVEKLVASDRRTSDHYSKSISISGDYAVVGSHRQSYDENGNNYLQYAGAVYVYENKSGDWTEVQKLVASDRNSKDNFGTAVSISGNTAVVGAYKRDTTIQGVFYSQVGAAYVYEKDLNDNWNLTQKLIASDLDSLNYFGKSVSISGDKMVIGAAYKNVNSHLQSGVAYVYEKDANGVWQEIQKISASDAADFTIFGWTVSISGDYIVVGAYKEDRNENGNQVKTDAGAAYVFKRNSSGVWQQQQKLVASDRNSNDWFGYNVAINNQTIVVGAYQESDDENGGNYMQFSGSAYVFELNNNTWQESKKIVANDRNTDDWFGYAVDVFENYIIVGARQDDEDEQGLNTFNNSGAAYIFQKNTSGTWLQTQKIVANDRNTDDWFGFSVAIDTNHLIVGAFSDKEDENGGNSLNDAGSAYIFESNNPTNTKDITKNLGIKIYPNPVDNVIKLEGNIEVNSVITIYNINGVKIEQIIYKNQPIKVNNLPNGIYYLSLDNCKNIKFIKL